jgi:PKD repeat protein
MKTTLRLALILSLLFLQGSVWANTVIVKGTIKNTANQAIANKKVKIYSVDSTNGGCAMVHYAITNPNGYYIDTLTCSGDIRKLMIYVENCDGTMLTRDPAVGISNLVEVNFIICTPGTSPATCKAAFSYQSLATGVKFNSAGSSSLAGDSIISRTWQFGDSSAAVTGNRIDPTHVYAKPGIYKVCLTITTKSGCQSSYCQTVVFTPESNDCKVSPVITIEKTGPKKFRFNSNQSTVLLGDSIFQRIWKFGDGSSLDGNQVNPLKDYRENGTYSVCLSIRTVKGCEKTICINVIVKDSVPPSTECKAKFSYAIQGRTVKFNSSLSAPATGDSIISRTWKFSDTSASLTGNRLDPSFTYSKAGKYTACLYIKTKNGCENKFCTEIEIKDSAASCKAYFTWERKDSLIVFNSAGSRGTTEADSIISRTWYYADSSISLSLGGNVIMPSYPYTKPGTYKVYLVIKTQSGCESKYGASVVILAPAPPAGCKALFTHSQLNGTVKFNSNGSRGTTEKDSVISRVWFFGDSTVPMEGNLIDPSHNYTKPGKYTVKLYIKTQSGCESKYSEIITIGNPDCRAEVQFTAERISLKKLAYNSSMSKALPGDSIIERTWKFGDNTILSGNEISPVKEFSQTGLYTTCLYVKTRNGCEAKLCREVVVKDTVTTPQANVDYIKIIQLNPNPVVTRMMATIYSRNNNAEAEITVFDIYGTAKFRIKKLLQQGNNMIEIGCESLYHGPYFLKVTTKNGRDSKAFYKL